MTRWCEMAGCDRYDATALSACGVYYVCSACQDKIACLSALYREQDEAEAARAKQAGASA